MGEAGEPVQLEGREKLQGEEILKTEAFNLVARHGRLKLNVLRSACGGGINNTTEQKGGQ